MPTPKRTFYRIARWFSGYLVGPYTYNRLIGRQDEKLDRVLWKYEPLPNQLPQLCKRLGIAVPDWDRWVKSAPRASFIMERVGPNEDPMLKPFTWPGRKNTETSKYVFAFSDMDQLRGWYKYQDELDILDERGFEVYTVKSPDFKIGLRQCLVRLEKLEIIKSIPIRSLLLTDGEKSVGSPP